MKNKILYLTLLACFLFSCTQPNVTAENTGFIQSEEISVDDKKYALSQDDIVTMGYVGQTHLAFALLSEKNDIQFMFSAFLTELKPGIYQVWNCKGPSNCIQEMDDKNQEVLFAPYPKNPLPPIDLSRIAYDAPESGLKPLTLTITSVTDEQQPGVPVKTKRIKGQYNGILAYVEKQDNGDWKIIGKTTKIEGKFDMYCSIR